MSVVLSAAAASLFGLGTWLLMQRRLSRIIIGLGLLGHGANLLLLLSAGRRGRSVFIGSDGGEFADPLPQAFALTAIVITFGVIAFLLALAWRSVELTGDDLVEDDREDRRIARRREVVDEEIADEEVLAAEQADERRVAHGEDE